MLQLIIDTTQNGGFCATVSPTNVLIHSLPKKGQAIHLPKSLENMLEEQSMSFKELSHCYVGIGPGSFAGSRIGVMYAKTLAYALNLPITPVASCLFYLPNIKEDFTFVSDAKSGVLNASYVQIKDEVYVCHRHKLLPKDQLNTATNAYTEDSSLFKSFTSLKSTKLNIDSFLDNQLAKPLKVCSLEDVRVLYLKQP